LRGYQKEGVVNAIRNAGGEIFGITSEPQTLATEARESWGLEFPLIGDPHHEIADQCRERGWLDLYVHTHADQSGTQRTLIARDIDTPIHPKGHFQPGVLALTPTFRILYRWRGVPTRRNNGGATERSTRSGVGGESKRGPLGTFRGASDKGRSVNHSSLSGLSARAIRIRSPGPAGRGSRTGARRSEAHLAPRLGYSSRLPNGMRRLRCG
jgi:hypothetical protein